MPVKIEELDDEQLAATAYVWHRRVKAGELNANKTLLMLEKELQRRLGPTPSNHLPLELAIKKRRAWWKLW